MARHDKMARCAPGWSVDVCAKGEGRPQSPLTAPCCLPFSMKEPRYLKPRCKLCPEDCEAVVTNSIHGASVTHRALF